MSTNSGESIDSKRKQALREYKRAERARDGLSRRIESKFKQVKTSQKATLNLDIEVIEELKEMSEYFQMSNHSRTLLINSFLKTRAQQVKKLITLSERIIKTKPEGFSDSFDGKIRAMAMEIAILGGGISELAKAHAQLFEAADKKAQERENLTVSSDEINLKDLEVFKTLQNK